MTSARFLRAALACSSAAMIATGALAEPTEKWCSGVNIAAFPGGPQGGVFANNVYNGFRQAELDLGPTVTYYFSNWDPNLMLQQIQQAVATGVDGIASTPRSPKARRSSRRRASATWVRPTTRPATRSPRRR